MKKWFILLLTLVIFDTVSYAQWSNGPTGVYYNGGNVSIGVSATSYKFHVVGSTYLQGPVRGSSNGALRIDSGNGWVDIGAFGSTAINFITDRPQYSFDKPVYFTGAISSSGTNPLTFQTNGTTRMTIANDNGHVGIGATSPNQLFHLKGTSHTYINLEKPGTSSEAGIVFNNGATTLFYLYNDDTNNALKIQASGLTGEADATPRMQFPVDNRNIYMAESGGNVGIGTASPGFRLDVNGPINATGLYLNGAPFTGNSQWTTSASDIYFNSGNVGIGTTSPQARLHVNGNLILDSALPSIFAGTGGADLNRYVSLMNSPQQQSATGLKAGGVLVSDSYAYANPGKNDLIVKGKVGIGTPLTSNPNNYTLAVNGTLNATGLYVNDQVFTSSQWSASGSNIFFNNAVGIGTSLASNPNNYKLAVNGTVSASGLYVNDQLVVSSQWTTSNDNVFYNGGVGIGTALTTNPNNYKLAVNGKIGAKEVRVETSSAAWPDYVFEPSYELPKLSEVEKYIRENKHLKDVPSQQQVEKEGHDLGSMDAILLKKVEELTLYVIELRKENEEMRSRLQAIEKKQE